MYKFAKLKLTKINGNPIKPIEYNWMLVLDSIELLNDFMDKVQKGIIKQGLSKLISKKYKYHCTDAWENVVELGAHCRGTSIIDESVRIENLMYQSRLKMILKYGKMYINQSGGGFHHYSDIEVVEEIEREDLIWPEYSEKDIKIIKWPNGTHYYAKIGNVDVVDEDGNQKWNKYKEAKQVAIEFLKKIK